MLTLTKDEIVTIARKNVTSFVSMHPPKYSPGRTDVAGTLVVSCEKEKNRSHFFVVWKNKKGIHCISELMPEENNAYFSIIPEYGEGDEIKDVRLRVAVEQKFEKKWRM